MCFVTMSDFPSLFFFTRISITKLLTCYVLFPYKCVFALVPILLVVSVSVFSVKRRRCNLSDIFAIEDVRNECLCLSDVLWCGVWMMSAKCGKMEKPGAGISLHLWKSIKWTARFNVLSNRCTVEESGSSFPHGMACPLGCGWGSRPPDMEISCEYIELAVVDSRPGMVFQLGGLALG